MLYRQALHYRRALHYNQALRYSQALHCSQACHYSEALHHSRAVHHNQALHGSQGFHYELRTRHIQPHLRRRFCSTQPASRCLSVLALESSCDDSSVAVLDVHYGKDNNGSEQSPQTAQVQFHSTVTAQTQQYNGIHPLVALDSHHANLANLVQQACQHMRQLKQAWKPTIVAVTRGPGMRSNLGVGLSIAKGLAAAWNVPMIGVHHMQAHALTPRLCRVLDSSSMKGFTLVEPQFPYLSVLVSGGHTMLLESATITEHKILAETQDIAIGDYLDKAARAILPAELCRPPYGRALELFAFPNGEADYSYIAPHSRQEELQPHKTAWSWSLRLPLQDKSGEKTSKRMIFSFSGLLTSIERIVHSEIPSEEERRDLAREVLRVAFEHLVSRILLHLATTQTTSNIVISGGVASNQYLRHVLRAMLDARGYSHINTIFPPVELCTDNALMIAWAGLEMHQAGYTTSLSVEPIRKWSMDSGLEDGGILGVSGWQHRSNTATQG